MLVELQRFNGAGWVTMTEDQGCVTVDPTHLAVSNPQGVFTTAGVCAAPPAAPVTTRGGRAWVTLPGTPDRSPGRLTFSLNLGASSAGQACQALGAPVATAPLALPHLSTGSDPSAILSWGRPNRDVVLTRERF
jgi:hypothetical protein